MDLAANIYRLTVGFPNSEQFGLTAQMRKCAVSIPSNIAEGWGRESDGDYLRHLRIARGSIAELETQLEISRCLEFVEHPELEQQVTRELGDVARLTRGLANKIQADLQAERNR